jgi:hypothetical protein
LKSSSSSSLLINDLTSSSNNSISSSTNSIQEKKQFLLPPSSLNSSQAQNINADFEAETLNSIYERFNTTNSQQDDLKSRKMAAQESRNIGNCVNSSNQIQFI